MPISWLSVLQAVPWTEVIRNAPRVAEGARKLWSSVGRKGGESSTADAADAALANDPATRIAQLETTVGELHAQMQASAELIKALAEQNAQLVARIESNRRRTLGLGIVVLGLLIAVLVPYLRAS
ncbi:MAG TPA: hypothetical protein VN028_07155 [Rhodocyclaceae bacterium]|nr:hypothetical protein [Rhodocyclaceae bacterium]